MADIITPILSIVSALSSCSTGNNRCCYLLDLQENKDALTTTMEELKDARDDVKRRVDEAENNLNEPMKCNQEVNGWLQRVQTIEGEVVQVIQKADQEIQGRCFGGYCPKNCWSARKLGKLVIRKLATVKDLRSKGSFVDVAYKLPPPLVQKEPVELTFGMESIFDEVWRWLAEDEVRIMGLYGHGGVGKTTLLKQINNEFLKSTTTTSTTATTYSFDIVILVVVSKAVNIDAIQMEIGKRLGLSSEIPADKTSIFNALTNKNFVLLLDDIWERIDLHSIGIPRLENKSKVVFTTRSVTVCGLMEANKMLKVQCLLWDAAWTLFQKKVGNETLNSHPKVPELAKIVARECSGLPLALITIGRAMSTKKSLQEWNHAITTLRKYASDFPGMSDVVLPLLKLSYDNLQNDRIKSCFLYCALFPEDHSISKANLVDYWIGEGLILLDEFDHIDEVRNHGYDVIENLKGVCLLESGEDEETHVKMHDTIRDLALWIAHKCGGIKRDKMLITGAFDHTSERLWYNAERIYMKSVCYDVTKVPPPPLKSPNLLTLIFVQPSRGRILIPQNYFEFMPLLRVQDLSGCHMKTFPRSITELLELQYLNLSWSGIKIIPEELRKLVKLKHLDLSYMYFLKEIPSGVISSLLELRVMNLYKCFAVWDIEEIYKLKHLNDLRITISTQLELKRLLINKNLRICTRNLCLTTFPISETELLSSSPSSSTTGLSSQNMHMYRRSLHQVPSLPSWSPHMSWRCLLAVGSVESLEKLEMLYNLETLSLDSLPKLANMGTTLQTHGAQYYHYLHSYFQNLKTIEFSGCHVLKDLTWVGCLPNLNTLDVSSCGELEEIINEDEISTKMINNVQDIFKSLKTLSMTYLPKLKSICRKALAFPCLELICICDCPELKKLPFDYGSNVNNTLQKIEGREEWWSKLQWEEGHDKNELKSKFLPHFVELGKKFR